MENYFKCEKCKDSISKFAIGRHLKTCKGIFHNRRKTKRGEGRKELIPSDIFVVTKLSDLIQRKDIRDKYNASLAEESPSCYKDITPTIETIESALIAERISELKPILTIKGL